VYIEEGGLKEEKQLENSLSHSPFTKSPLDKKQLELQLFFQHEQKDSTNRTIESSLY